MSTPSPTQLPSQPPVPCGDYTIIYDGLEPTIKNEARAPKVFVAEILAVGQAGLVPFAEIPGGEGNIPGDAYRLLTLDVTDVAKGAQGPPIRKVMVPGGTVGCARFFVAGLHGLAVGKRYVFFVEERNVTVPGGPSAPVAYSAWPVSAAGEVKTPLEGDLTIDAFVAAVRSAGR